MKKIIDGKIYNTETAEKIGFYCNGESGFGRFHETLYKTQKGRYFTHGEGVLHLVIIDIFSKITRVRQPRTRTESQIH